MNTTNSSTTSNAARTPRAQRSFQAPPLRVPPGPRLKAREFAERYLPDYCTAPFNQMHLGAMDRYDQLTAATKPGCPASLRARKGVRLATAAPRGAAKSTIHTLLIPLMDVCYGNERHIVIISATTRQASARLRAIEFQLLHNEQLREDFGITAKSFTACNRRVLEINGLRIEAYGAASEMRGISYGSFRPTRIILDDAEHERLSRTPEGRRAMIDWYDETIEHLGDTYTNIDAVGTVLHRDSLLPTLMKRPDFDPAAFRSVISWANDQTLWEEWKTIRCNLDNEERLADSDAFYLAHEAKMLEGTEVLWPEKESYLDLQKLMIRVGRPAFFKEKQNEPLNEEWHIFQWNQFRKFDLKTGQIHHAPAPGADPNDASTKAPPLNLADLQIFGFLDPATGTPQSARRGDYASIVTVGRDKAGIHYVLDVWMERTSVSRQVDKLFELHAIYKYTAFGYEANGFQHLAHELITNKQDQYKNLGRPPDLWQIPLFPTTHTQNKVARIQALEPQIDTGWIRFLNELNQTFVEQVETFPTNRHDDALDALAGCVELARKRTSTKPIVTLAGTPRPRNLNLPPALVEIPGKYITRRTPN